MTQIRTVTELHNLPVFSKVSTGSGYVYTKGTGGRWSSTHSLMIPGRWLLDPEHSVQPITLLRHV
jgi:hypothetical protein